MNIGGFQTPHSALHTLHTQKKERLKTNSSGIVSFSQAFLAHSYAGPAATAQSIGKSNVIIATTFSVIPHCGGNSISIIFRETIYGA